MHSNKQLKYAREIIRALNEAMKPFVDRLREEEKKIAARRKDAVAEAKRLGVKDVHSRDGEPRDLGSDEGAAWVARLYAVALIREEELIEDRISGLKASLDPECYWDGRVITFDPSGAVNDLDGAELEWNEYNDARSRREKALASKAKRKQACARRKKTG